MTIDSKAVSSADLNQIDPLTPEVLACPYAFYARLRDEAPVWKVPDRNLYIISRHRDIIELNQKPEIFSNDLRHIFNARPEVSAILAEGVPEHPTLGTADPPDHRRYRTLVNKAFTLARINKLVPYLERMIDEQIDTFICDGELDLIEQFAVPLTVLVTADQLGVPRDDRERYKEWSDARAQQLSFMLPLDVECAGARKRIEFQEYFKKRFAEKQADPTDDMISVLATAKFDDLDRGLTVPEFLSIAEQLMTAGNVTTTAAFGTTMKLLLDQPDIMREVMADFSKLPAFIDESLRFESTAQGLWRITTCDTEIAGVPIPAGSVINARGSAANRDPENFPNPEQFDLTRDNLSTHLTFGSGPHFCIGAMLARKELELGLRALLIRLKDLRFAPGQNDFELLPSFTLRGFKHLYLHFDPA